MNKEKICLSSQTIDISEHDNYLELTNRLCYYDDENLNKVMLPYNGVEETAQEYAKTLINEPVQAKYKKVKGLDDLGGHEMSVDKNGNYTFGTASIGTHTNVWISEPEDVLTVNGEIKKLPCLYATARIWKRNANVIAAIKRLFNSPSGLNSSWEISTRSYEYMNGVKKLTDYEFIGNTFLGSNVTPAYKGTSKTIAIASEELNSELMIAEALSQDLINIEENKEESEEMKSKSVNTTVAENTVDTQNVNVNSSSVSETGIAENATPDTSTTTDGDNTTTNDTDTAQLTDWDLREAVRKACRAKLDKWCWVSYLFPNEKEVWCEYDERPTELDYVKFTYEVGEDDTIKVSEPIFVKLTVSIAEVNTKIAELEKEVETVKAELNIKNDAITKASETIQSLNVQISELTPFKAQVEADEQKRIEAEIAEEKDKLRAKMLKGGLFTETEIAEKEISELIEARDTTSINSLIADRFVASFDVKADLNETTTVSAEEVSTATANLETEDVETDVRSFMSKILF